MLPEGNEKSQEEGVEVLEGGLCCQRVDLVDDGLRESWEVHTLRCGIAPDEVKGQGGNGGGVRGPAGWAKRGEEVAELWLWLEGLDFK